MHKISLRPPKFCFSYATALRRASGLALLALVVACGSAPVQEMSEARQAIEAARAAGAEQYAEEQYNRAQSLLKTAEDMLNERHFRKARESAAKARDEAILAREAAQQATPK